MLGKRLVAVVALIGLFSTAVLQAQSLTPIERLGKAIFFDTNLSNPPGQSCASCHAPETGFTGPDSNINRTLAIYPGAVPTRFGNRRPPTAAYGGNPVLRYDESLEVWIGGTFWDGRATGWILGDPLAEQAQGPFLNPLEQNLPSALEVCRRISKSDYAGLFKQVWGPDSLNLKDDVAGTYERVARSIAAYERSSEVSSFTSKYDAFLAKKVKLTAEEALGLKLFEGKGKCAACHPSKPAGNKPPLFTDFTFDNLGIPKNPQNPFYDMAPEWNPDGENWIDPGLGGFLQSVGEEGYQTELGKHKVPTLRNVGKRPNNTFVKAYGHNGFFKSLKDIVHFYNTRDVKDWPDPEVPENVNTTELGKLGLTAKEEAAIVAFLNTLSDGFKK